MSFLTEPRNISIPNTFTKLSSWTGQWNISNDQGRNSEFVIENGRNGVFLVSFRATVSQVRINLILMP